MISFKVDDFFVVTGASSGIGKAISLLLNQLGASLVGVSSNVDKLIATKNQCQIPENFHIEVRDLSKDLDDLPAFMLRLKEKHGQLKGLVNCAGITHNLPLRIISEKDINDIFNINYKAPILLSKGFADRRVHVKGESVILFIASIASHLGDKSQTIYAASKASLIASSSVLAHELAPSIRVNCISPGFVETELYRNTKELVGDKLGDRAVFGIGKPIEIANLVAFLLSNKSRWITAQNYIIDGGYF